MFKKIAGVAVVSALAASMSGCFLSVTDGTSIANKSTAVVLTGWSPYQNGLGLFTCQKDASSAKIGLLLTTAGTSFQLADWKAPMYYNTANYNKALPAGCWKQNAKNYSTVLKLVGTYNGTSYGDLFTYTNSGVSCLQSSTLYPAEVQNGGKVDVAYRGLLCATGTASTLYAPL